MAKADVPAGPEPEPGAHNPDNDDHQTLALRELNAKIHGDPRVTPVLLPIGDGLTLARRR